MQKYIKILKKQNFLAIYIKIAKKKNINNNTKKQQLLYILFYPSAKVGIYHQLN